jgi:hypothetical protein
MMLRVHIVHPWVECMKVCSELKKPVNETDVSLFMIWIMSQVSCLDNASVLIWDQSVWLTAAEFLRYLLTNEQRQNFASACEDLEENLQDPWFE